MELEKCEVCQGTGCYEVSSIDPIQSCEDCGGNGVVSKKLNIRELRAKFKESEKELSEIIGYSVNLHINSYGNFSDWRLQDKFNTWIRCVKALDILREEK